MIKKYLLYLFRWQLSTPILALVLWVLSKQDKLVATIVANFIGGLIFFWVDRFIFKTKAFSSIWEVRDDIVCSDCGEICKGYRLVKAEGYDKTYDKNPKFRCPQCSSSKTQSLKKDGIVVNHYDGQS